MANWRSPGITWHHLASPGHCSEWTSGCHWLSSVVHAVCGMPMEPMDAMYVCISPASTSGLPRFIWCQSRDLWCLSCTWWILVNLGGWCDHPDESWWISGLTRTVSGGSADWAQVQTWLKCTGPAPISRRHKMTWPIDRAFCLILKLLSSRLCLAVPLRDLNWLVRSYKKIEGT